MRRLLRALICCFLGVHICLAASPTSAQKFDEFDDGVSCEDEKARLDYFAYELRQSPLARAYIIFYGGRTYYAGDYSSRPAPPRKLPRRGEAEARAERMKPYLTNQGIDPERIILLHGGFREYWTAELWVVSAGEEPPKSTPTLQPRDIKFRRGKATARKYYLQCMEG
jgi:uncharacterized SAM-binding protein YcdF (DUF218 family)